MKEVNIISKVVGRDGASKNISPGAMNVPSADLSGYLPIKDWNEVFSVRIDANGVPYLFGKLPFVTQYGITMYADGGEMDLPSLFSGIPIDGDTIYWENGVLKAKESEVISLEGYATEEWVNSRINSIINGAPAAYDTLKEIADVLQGNINSIGDIINVLGTKWTQDDAKIANWDAAYSWGDHSKVGYALKNYVDDTFVTLATNQTITGEKNFTGGLKVNGSPIVYDATNKYWKLEGDLLVTGGVTMYASDSAFTPSTIMDAIATDGTNLKVVNGVLTFVGSIDGGEAGSVAWGNVEGKPSWIGSSKPSYSYSEISGTPTLLSSFTNDVGFITSFTDTKNTAGATNTSSKIFLIGATAQNANPQTYSHDTAYVGTNGCLYSGGVKVLTAHQTIYNLTMQAGAFSAVTFDPNGAAKTVNIPTTTSHISEGDNLYYTNARAQAAITGGASTIATSNLTASRALVSNSSGKVAVSAVTSTELSYLDGVTSAIQTQLNAKLDSASYTAADVLTKLKTVDGSGSGLDADTLDGTEKSKLFTSFTYTPMETDGTMPSVSAIVGGVTKSITLGYEGLVRKGYAYCDITLNSYWVKIASVTLPYNYDDYAATLCVESPFNSGEGSYLVKWACRTSGTTTSAPSCSVRILGSAHHDFRVYNSGAGSTITFELWANLRERYGGIAYTVIQESDRKSVNKSELATYYNTDFTTVQTPTLTYWVEHTFDSIGNNSASATKLKTPRTIWGQSFDGTKNISGALSGATTGSFSSNVTIGGTLGVTGDTTLASKLTLNGIPIYKSQDDVLYIDGNLAVRGGITMYATDAIDVPSIIDALPIASASAKGIAAFNPNDFSVVDGYVSFIGSGGVADSVHWDNVDGKPTFATVATSGKYSDLSGVPTLLSSFINDKGFASSLGELANVGSWADSSPAEGRLLYQAAGSSVWSYKNVSEFISETGAYLPLSGGTLNGNLSLGGNKINNVQALQFASGVIGAANSGCSILGAFDNPYSATIQLGGYGTTPPSNATSSYYSFKIVDNAWTSELFMVNNDGKNVFGCKAAINDNRHVRGVNIAGQLKFTSTTPTIPHPMIFGDGSYLTIGYGNVTNYGIVIASGEVRPNATDLFNLGLRSYRWKSIHTIDVFLGGYAQFDDMISNGGGTNTGAARIGTFDHTEGGLVIQLGKSTTADNTSSGKQKFEVINPAWNMALLALDRAGNLGVTGGITMYSDIRKKTKLQDVELSLKQIADAPLIEHYYNSDAMRTTHVGSIAQYWAGLNDWFCKLDGEGYYTMEIQNAALASAISIARELVKYESKTDRKIRLLKQRVKELEEKIEKLENN